MGASLLWRRFGGEGGNVPDSDPEELSKNSDIVREAIISGLVKSCHDCSDGGAAVAVSEMCIGGNVGFEGTLPEDMPAEVFLFSESNSRFILEIDAAQESKWKELAGDRAQKIGELRGDKIAFGSKVSISVQSARDAWSKPLWNIMG